MSEQKKKETAQKLWFAYRRNQIKKYPKYLEYLNGLY